MSIIATVNNKIIAESGVDRQELRASNYGVLDLFRRQTEAGVLLPAKLQEQALSSIGKVVSAPVINYDGNVTIGNVRSVTIGDDESDTAMVDFTFVTFAWGFTMVKSGYINNYIQYEKDFEAKYLKYLYRLMILMEEQCNIVLEDGKTQVFNTLLAKYTKEGNTLVSEKALQAQLIGDLGLLMNANDFFGPFDVAANYETQSLVRNELKEMAKFNQRDKTYQYGDKNWGWSNRVPRHSDATTATYGATGFIVEPHTVGMLFRVERESLLGTTSRTGHEWDTVILPFLEIPCGTYYYESVGDQSGQAGSATADNTRARKDHYGFSVDVSFCRTYQSAPDELPSGIIKFAVRETPAA